jgi:hypothetical protein
MAVLFVQCAKSRTKLDQPASSTATFTLATPPAESATRFWRTRVRLLGTWPSTWAVFAAIGAIGRLHPKLCLGDTSRRRAKENNFDHHLKLFLYILRLEIL